MKTTVAAALAADATLTALLPGGIHTTVAISKQLTPAAFPAPSLELIPCCLVADRTARPDTSGIPAAARHTVEIYLYEHGGVEAIEPARRRIYQLLHRQTVSLPSGAGTCLELTWGTDVLGQRDDALGCQLILSRYSAALMR